MNFPDHIKKDWRLTNQDEYLLGVKLIRKKYEKSLLHHEHCEFCWTEISGYSGALHEGYCTLDGYHWICEQCYHDFKEYFSWTLGDDV